MPRKILKVLILFVIIKSFLFCNYLSADEWKSYTVKDGLVNNMVRCIAVDEERKEIWFGTKRGVSRFNGKNKWTNYTSRDGLSSNEVNSILIDGGNIWFGTKEGLCKFNKNNEWSSYTVKNGLANNQVNVLALKGKNLWIGTEGGLSRLDKTKGKFTTYTTKDGLFDDRIKDIIIKDGYLLVVSSGAKISVLDFVKQKWNIYTLDDAHYANIGITREGGIIWCGTNGLGMRAYNRIKKTWKNYTISEGLADNFIQAIAADGRYIWVGTFNGISCFDTVKEKWKNFYSRDGLVNDSVSAIAIDGENIWFGTDDGVSRYNKEVPQVAINLERGYLTKTTSPLKIDCIGFAYCGIKEIVAEYSISSFSDIWIKEGIEVVFSKKKRHLTINWDLKELPSTNDLYNLRLTVYDKKGRNNTSVACLIIDKIKPLVKFDVVSESMEAGIQVISGSYNKDNVDKIIVYPGGILAEMDSSQRRFRCLVTLKEGKNPIKVTLSDWLGRKAQADTIIIAKKETSKDAILVEKVKNVKKNEVGIRLTMQEMFLFSSGSAQIKTEGLKALKKVVDYLKGYSLIRIKIEGHTDNVPIKRCSYSTNLELSKARAESVFKYLIQDVSIPAEKFVVKGYGESRSKASNATAKGRAKNRRVEIIVIKEK